MEFGENKKYLPENIVILQYIRKIKSDHKGRNTRNYHLAYGARFTIELW